VSPPNFSSTADASTIDTTASPTTDAAGTAQTSLRSMVAGDSRPVDRSTDRNGFIKQNLSDLREETDLTNFVFSPSAGGGIAAAGITVTPASTQLSVTLTAPSLPTGWTISKAIAAIIRQQDPQSGTLYNVSVQEDSSSPYSGLVFTGLINGQVYIVGGWFEFIKPDGTFAYGQALMDDGTPA